MIFMPQPFVPIILGSNSDLDREDLHIPKIGSRLAFWNIDYVLRVCSADKYSRKLEAICEEYDNNPDLWVVYITCAGRRDALSGGTAGNYTSKPVIACPPSDKEYGPIVHLSSHYLPSDDPVLFCPDPKNAADSAARIFGLYNEELATRLTQRKIKVREGIDKDDKAVMGIRWDKDGNLISGD